MEAPKEIYIRPNEMYPGKFHWDWLRERHYGTDVKYIRADLAELTAEDIKTIYQLCVTEIMNDKNNYSASADVCVKVLNRFNEQRK